MEYNVIIGPYIKPLTKNVKRALAPKAFEPAEIRAGKQVVYMCGSNAAEVGEIFRKSIAVISSMMDPDDSIVFIEDDESRFDLHIRAGAFGALHAFYKTHLPPNIVKLLRRNDRSKGRSKLGVKYTIPWTMQSGAPDTSLADTVINAMMKYDIHGLGDLWVSIVMGDDSVTVTTRKTLAKMGGVKGVLDQYIAFGMEIELLVKDDAADVEMCSSRFFKVGTTYVLLPKTGKIIARSLTDRKDRPARRQHEWLRGIATGHENTGKVDYLVGQLAIGIRRAVGTGIELVETNIYKVHHTTDVRSDWLDVCTFYDHHYGLSEAMVKHAGDQLATIRFGSLSSDSVLASIVQMDC